MEKVSFTLHEGDILAVTGRTGSGKTTLLKTLLGKIFHTGEIIFSKENPSIVLIGRQHRFHNLSHTSTFYYQQRFNSFDAEDSNTVEEEFNATGLSQTRINEVVDLLQIRHILESRLIQLSNGEHKRFQIAKALLKNAEWLLLDNPYTGLDINSRRILDEILKQLSDKGIHLVIVTSPGMIPSIATHVATIDERSCKIQPTGEYIPAISNAHTLDESLLQSIPAAYPYEDFEYAIRMIQTNISYSNKRILNDINWEVKNGECWNLRGHNGSGKSTLLSLVNGDNPQAFANEIYLFDKRKGTGESIWDIKQKIGFISPELHHYFDGSSNAFDITASGLFDTIGLFKQLSSRERHMTEQWMKLLEIDHLSNRLFTTLSDGEQRLVLLARALVKNPPLLILDEPCQGLDDDFTGYFVKVIDQVCRTLNKTLIYVSHFDPEIPSIADKRLELVDGKIKK